MLAASLVLAATGLAVYAPPGVAKSVTAATTPAPSENPKLSGTPTVGQTLTCSTGSWTGNPSSFAYAWLRDGALIAGQTGSTYTLQSGDAGHSIACQVTAGDSGGEYTIPGLSAGSYKVSYTAQSQAGDYTGASFPSKVAVSTGSVTGSIDAVLGNGGEITGRITGSAGGSGVAGVVACAEAEVLAEGCVETNANGEYTISGLRSGSYHVWFRLPRQSPPPTEGNLPPAGSLPVAYSWNIHYGETTPGTAASVSVVAGSVTPDIDAVVETGTVTGRITSAAGGTPLSGVEACASRTKGGLIGGCVLSGANGEYTIEGIETGTYEVAFAASQSVGNFLTQYYNDKAVRATATKFTVGAGAIVSGIDAEMKEGGAISGVVTSATGSTPIAGAAVCANAVVFLQSGPCARTNTAGEYTIVGLATGSYHVTFFPEANNYLIQYFEDIPSEEGAAEVAVTAGTTTKEVDAKLEAGGQIAGTVTSTGTHAPIAGVFACAEDGQIVPERCARTDESGHYTITNLSSGPTFVRFWRGLEGPNYAPQYYNGSTTEESATPIVVSLGGSTSGVDAELQPAGEISGRVTSSSDGLGIGGIEVCAERTEAVQHIGEQGECALTDGPGGSASATSNALSVSAAPVASVGTTVALTPSLSMTGLLFNSKTGTLTFRLRASEGGRLGWSLYLANADIGFAASLGVSGRGLGALAVRASDRKRCRAGTVRHAGRCAPTLVRLANGSKSVGAGTTQVAIRLTRRARTALSAGHTVHLSGSFTLHTAGGAQPVSQAVKLALHGGHVVHLGVSSFGPRA